MSAEDRSDSSTNQHEIRHILPLLLGIELVEIRNSDGSLANYAASPTKRRSLRTGIRPNTVMSTGETPLKTIRELFKAEKSARAIRNSR